MRLHCEILLFFMRFLYFLTLCNTVSYAKCDFNNSCTNKDIVVNDITSKSMNIEKCPNVKSTDVLLKRKKRALAFPENSSFVINVSFGKVLMVGIPLNWNSLLECDVLFKSPGLQDLFRFKYPRLLLHKRQRRELWRGIEDVFNINGLNGENCLLGAICEVKYILAPKDTVFLHDIIRIFLTVPEIDRSNDRYQKASKEEDCTIYFGEDKCPFSPLKLLMSSVRKI